MFWSYPKVEHQIFLRQSVDAVFQMLDPCAELGALFRSAACGLVRQIGGDVAVGENDLAALEGLDNGPFVLEAIAGVEQRSKVWIDRVDGAEIAVQELADHLAEPGIVLRESGREHAVPSGLESLRKKANLGLFAAAVYAFDGDQLSASGHE